MKAANQQAHNVPWPLTKDQFDALTVAIPICVFQVDSYRSPNSECV